MTLKVCLFTQQLLHCQHDAARMSSVLQSPTSDSSSSMPLPRNPTRIGFRICTSRRKALFLSLSLCVLVCILSVFKANAQLTECSGNSSPHIALVRADIGATSTTPMKDRLQARFDALGVTGATLTAIDGRDPPPSQSILNSYDVIFVWSYGTNFDTPTTWGTALSDYLGDGGRIVLSGRATSTASLDGKWDTLSREPFSPVGHASHYGSTLYSMNEATWDADHPLLGGVESDFRSSQNTRIISPITDQLLDNDVVKVAEFDNLGANAIFFNQEVLVLNWVPLSTVSKPGLDNIYSNAVLYACASLQGGDGCPSDPNKTRPGSCGCGEPETDTDGDGIADCVDNCPNNANADQADDDSDGVGNVCACPLEDTSCNYQPDPPVVTFSDVVIGDDNLAYYRIQMNASAHWSEYVKVLFPESDNDHCDYPSGVVTWNVTTASDDPCAKQYSVDIPMDDFLGKCGFSQAIRNGDSMFFQQTAQIMTNRTCEDGRINQLSLSDVELSETRSVSRETQYEIEIIAPTNATAKTGGLEVFGTAFKLDLLGDLTIIPDIDTNMPTISGFFVTETQHPYELQDPVFALTGDFNYATFELTGTYCTADNSTRLPCQQTWSYSFQPNQTCPDKAQLEGELVQVTWNVNCSDGFIGECAPSFAVQPEATFSLNSPIYCFSSDYIELTPALEVYQFDQLTANSANFGASTLGTLTDNGFSVERVFTIDSQLYAEYTVVAAGTGVTLTATTLKKVSTTTSSRGELVLYETNAAEQVITQATTFSVHDTGFGTDESSDFADYRTRFQFTWLNETTVLLDSTEDLAQTIALSATSISIFTNVQSLRKAGIDEHHPVLSKLNSDQHSKEQEDKHMILFGDSDEPRDSRTTILARLAPASTTNTPAASTASSGFVVSPTVTVVAAGIALIALVALVAFAVVRRSNNSALKADSEAQHQLPASSSGMQLTDFAMPVMATSSTSMTVTATPQMSTLQSIAGHYSTNPDTVMYAMQ
jgi:hypothetical protein